MPLPLLHYIAELSEDVLYRGLAHLQGAEFLYETQLFPEQVYTFKHALTHEVAYGSLLHERRRVLHARIVEAIEALASDRVAEQVERLAYHAALRGEVWDKAVTCCQQAGVRAYDRAAFREAVAAFEQALQALAHLPESGDTRALAIELRLALQGLLSVVGEFGRCRVLLGEAEALARALDDGARLGRVLAHMAFILQVKETPTAPWQRVSRPSRSRPRSATAPYRWKHPIASGRSTCPRRFRPGGRAAAAERRDRGLGVWHAQH